jgi:hypothetical protein
VTAPAPGQTPEEIEAAELEQIVPISKEGLLMQRKYHRLQNKMKELKAELDEAQAFLEAECAEKNAKKLTYKGVVAVEIVNTTQTKNDYKGLWETYPLIQQVFVSEFQSKTPATRFDAKKPV